MNVADILDKAADLIEPEGAWTQGWFARNAGGSDTGTNDEDAVCWCAFGAVERACQSKWSKLSTATNLLGGLVGGMISDWNDAPERTQAEVVSKLREAAALAREQGK